MMSPLEEGELKEAIYAENNIIISPSTLCKVLPPHLKNMSSCYNLCVVVSIEYLTKL